jgi:hypothetical protein
MSGILKKYWVFPRSMFFKPGIFRKCIINTVEERNNAKEGIRSKSLHSTVPTKWMKKRKI